MEAPLQSAGSLNEAHFDSASSMRGSVRDNSLDVITEEQEVLITQIPATSYPSSPTGARREDGEEEVPAEGMFVPIADIEQFIVDYDSSKTPTIDSPPLGGKPTLITSPLSITNAVPSDDEDYETDLEFDEEVWLNPDKSGHDITGKTSYMKVCGNLGITPISSYVKHLHEREINLKYYGLSVPSAKAISVPFESNTVTEKLNLEGNGIEEEATKFLCRTMKDNLYMTELVLRDNKIGRQGALAVCDLMLHNRCIAKLDLSGNQIDDDCAPLLAKVLAVNTCLKQLQLAHNCLEDGAARHFQEVITENETLELLDLGWNHFGTVGSAMLLQSLQENVGLKYFYMPMAGMGCSGCVLLGDMLKMNRTLLELDVSYCRIAVSAVHHVADGLRENEILRVLKVGSNPLDADSAMLMLKAIEENETSAVRHLDLANIFVSVDLVTLAGKLQDQRGLTVFYEGVLPAPLKFQKSMAEMIQFRTDPIGHLRTCLEQVTKSPSEIFHLNGPAKINKHEFTDTVRMAQLDLSREQIKILFSKLQSGGLIDIEHLLDLLENPLPPELEEE